MGEKTKQFIQKAKQIHGEKYNYSLVDYVSSRDKVNIICPNHGIFSQRANSHLRGTNCKKCGYEKLAKSKSDTKEQFIEKAKLVHENTYDYSKGVYKNAQTKIEIICKEHGSFFQKPNGHLTGLGCEKCGIEERTKTTKDFIDKSNIVHNNKYKYTKTIYKRSDEKVIITCPIHGDFKQTPSSHQIGKGCIKCAHEYVTALNKERPKIWSYTGWQENGENSKHFDSFKVYIIKCWNDEEEFYKIGKTYTTLERRFGSTLMPYNYEIIKLFKNNSEHVSKLEHKLHKQNKLNSYTPTIGFAGMNECYSKINNYNG